MEELRDISEPTMVATERTIKMSFRILGYSVLLHLQDQRRVLLRKWDPRLPLGTLQAFSTWLERAPPSPNDVLDVAWHVHALRDFVQLVVDRKAFFTDALLAYATADLGCSVLEAAEDQHVLRLVVPDPAQAEPHTILVLLWAIGFDASGRCTSALHLHLTVKERSARRVIPNVDTFFHGLVAHGASLNNALRALMNRLAPKAA